MYQKGYKLYPLSFAVIASIGRGGSATVRLSNIAAKSGVTALKTS